MDFKKPRIPKRSKYYAYKAGSDGKPRRDWWKEVAAVIGCRLAV